MNYDSIGSFIADLRKKLNLTQKELAAKLGVTDKAVSKWERGLGCPDVSLLDNLSQILGVSILEILKGRNINESELTNDKIHDYVLETVKYSDISGKEKIKKIALYFLTIIIVSISIFLISINILHSIELNKTFYYDFTDSIVFKNIKTKIDVLEKNIYILENSKTIYEIEDKKQILTYLNESYKKHLIIEEKLENQKKLFNQTDIYKILLYVPSTFNFPAVFDVLKKYDVRANNYKEYIVTSIVTNAFLGNENYERLSENYKYRFNFNEQKKVFQNPLNIMLYDILSGIEMINFSAQYIIEVGVINE